MWTPIAASCAGGAAAARAAALSTRSLVASQATQLQQLRFARTGRHRATIKHKLFMHPPRSVVREEARKMGELDVNLVEKIAPRPVPTSSAEFAARRREFKAEMTAVRKQYSQEWAARREREAAAMQSIVEESNRRAALRRARKDEHKALRAALHRQTLSQQAKLRGVKREAASRAQQLWLANVAARRAEWLDKLEADAAAWIPEDRIDELINEDTFAMKYPWQYEEFFANSASKRLASETRKRMHVHQLTAAAAAGPGPDAFEDGYPSDWEEETAVQAVAAAEAAEEGELDDMTAASFAHDIPASSGGTPSGLGLQLEELYYGKPAEQLRSEAHAAMAGFMEGTASAGASAAGTGVGLEDSLDDVLALMQEDGEGTSAESTTPVDEDWTSEALGGDDPAWGGAFGKGK